MLKKQLQEQVKKQFEADKAADPKKNDLVYLPKLDGITYRVNYFRDVNVSDPQWSMSYEEVADHA